MTPVMVDGLPERLAQRLTQLAHALHGRSESLALLGLGSIGLERNRADDQSDLDFFVIVQSGAKAAFIERLDWLEAAHPLAWHFQNTVDGHKAVMADGLVCEFAVFEAEELRRIPYSPGRWIWRRDESIPVEWANPSFPLPGPRPSEWLVGEALSNLVVGLLRYRRGERLAAMRMVQVYALDRLLEWINQDEAAACAVSRDPFNADRRFEFRHPDRAPELTRWAAGIEATPACAVAILEALERRTDVPGMIGQQIRALAVVTRQGHELIENPDPISESRASISQPQCLNQFLVCRYADLPRHVALLPTDHPSGNKLREATGQRR